MKTRDYFSVVNRVVFLLPLLAACQSSGLQFEESSTSANSDQSSLEMVVAETGDSQLRVMDRAFVKATLDGIFGPSISAITNARVDQAISEFGGPCDSYSLMSGCAVSGSTQFSVVASTVPAREALRVRACDQIVANDAALLFATRHIQESISSLSGLATPTQSDIELAYDLFYTGRDMPETVRTALSDVVKTAEGQSPAWPKSEAWRFLFLTLCLASDWQTP